MVEIGIPLGAAAIALVCLVLTVRVQRDHRSLTAKSLARALQTKQDLALEEADGRHASLRRDFNSLANDVGDMLEDAGRKAQRATMRNRRADEQAAAVAAVTEAKAPTWEEMKKQRIRAAEGM